jgi:hypothetical protein
VLALLGVILLVFCCVMSLSVLDIAFVFISDVETCVAAKMHASPRAVPDTTIVFQESQIHPLISGGA